MSALQYSLVRPAVAQSNPTTVAPYLFWQMFRNVASDGFVFEDPVNVGVVSKPGCVLASPSWENSVTQVSQDYVYNWTRDPSTAAAAAATALQAAGDQMLQAVVFHSDNLELSEQFDATTGYEKSVSNLSWSYASFLSAVRAKNAI